MWQHLRSIALGLVVAVGLWSIIASQPTQISPSQTAQSGPASVANSSVTLTHQSGDAWYIYRGVSTDPLSGRHAVIRSIVIAPGVGLSLAHGDDPTFYAMSPGESNAFNGKPVEGAWSAQLSGNRTEAPTAITFTVNW
jgi:hypothetical protein